ncbi:hypothetical protein ELI20_01105 [Rhizobium ruizarguesonis]|jgi:hypothetical protein|uniref:ABC-three component system protein n=1 Tax=Rhizobium ruizarguesonis TaxID=2081791 RepID=UPI00102F65BD|nr:ABC-three component system protein [Rhizobium ruizarguesonis]TAW19915.1 hypothetical protein ELI20_01105 [Rhizobium ruizarguesonis]
MTLSVAEATAILRRYEAPSHPNLFFVGQADKRITFYSQQVRTLELVHALSVCGRLSENDRVAVIGAGAAGLTAEMALNILRIRVELFDPLVRPLDLQAGSPRMLDPKIYEWPRPGSLDLRADLPLLDWSRGTAEATRNALLHANLTLEALVATHRPLSRHFGAGITSATNVTGNWELSLSGGGPAQAFTKIIVASGFGVEPDVGTAAVQPYWSAAGPPQPVGVNARCLVSGVGDGGLTDMMALLVLNFEHRQFTQEFLNLVPTAELANAVLVADQAAVGAINLQSQYDLGVRPILVKWGVIDALAPKLVAGRSIVVNASDDSILTKGAASKLNQVMAYALQLAALAQNLPRFAIAGGRLNNVTDEADGRKLVHGPTLPGGAAAGIFDLVVVRHGPRKGLHFAWLDGKYEQFVAHRETLAALDQASLEPPALRDDTYTFFHEKQDFFHAQQARQERANVRERRAHLLILQHDPSTHSVVERGALSLLHAVTSNQAGLEVHLADAPTLFEELASVLARALISASPRIEVTCPPQHHGAWSILIPTIVVRHAQLPVSYAAAAAPSSAILSGAVDAVLLTKLNSELAQVWQTGVCEVGHVHQTIIDEIQPVWAIWFQTLTDDPALCSHVLQTLWKGDAGSSWDGNHGCLSRLTAALVLMMASSLGIGGGLGPDMVGKQSNLAYPAGLAIGSGCNSRLGKRIDDCNDPDAWDADIVMLSSAVDLDFALNGSMAGAGGDPGLSFAAASRVAPALVMSSRRWRTKLAGPLPSWRDEVASELQEFQARRDAGLTAL